MPRPPDGSQRRTPPPRSQLGPSRHTSRCRPHVRTKDRVSLLEKHRLASWFRALVCVGMCTSGRPHGSGVPGSLPPAPSSCLVPSLEPDGCPRSARRPLLPWPRPALWLRPCSTSSARFPRSWLLRGSGLFRCHSGRVSSSWARSAQLSLLLCSSWPASPRELSAPGRRDLVCFLAEG